MLEWFFAVCILIAAALFWPASLYFASGGPLPAPPGAPGRRILGCRTGATGGQVRPRPRPRGDGRSGGRGAGVQAVGAGPLPAEALRGVPQPRRPRAGAGGPAPSCRPSPPPAGLRRAPCAARDHLQVADGGLVALDWAVAGGEGHKRRRTASDSASPVLLVIPNSFGKITWNVLKLCDLGLSHGYAPVVFNRRGQNGAALATPRLQRFGDPADLREAVRYLRYRRPGARLYAASESTGAGLLLSYLGECGSSSYLTAAACLSPVLRCQAWYESAPCWPYGWALLLYQKICLSSRSPSPRGRGGDGAEGGVSWEEYWESNEPLRDVDEVAVPVLCVCSRDDPVRGDPSTTLPFDLFHSNPHLFLLLTEQGGHCGFAQPGAGPGGVMGTAPWSHRALLEFFRGVTDFFAAEERAQAASHRRGLRGGAGAGPVAVGNSRGFRHCSISACKRLPACSHSIHSIYSWQRSYTR
ncbi:hypothetical protein ANANG_G00165820 [Anguilla anguilla]|uniref:Serine aminopeptidase S33 domain-containing protein n=1 Tax=Anguilla anguilla TaxID=7936 RepID=A0A9D3M965_ANGAN|nr:hypothetical protein ANANG_G00165820 [Anguilla anguilla]